MKTFKDLKDEIERIAKIDVKGFDSEQVLRKFARDQALTNIALIKPYTDKYELIVQFLVTGKNADAAYAASAAAGVAAADDTYAADATSANYAATYAAIAATSAASATSSASTDAASAASAFATDATYAADAYADYTDSVESLNTLANEYLACAE